ncbi:MAG: nitroreductase family protein [Petrotogales bacterium]
MDVYEAILSRRSIRRFQQKQIDIDVLKKLVNAGRLAPSAANLQPLEYFIVNEKNLCGKIFETLSWAGYIKPKWRPSKEERPTAYIIVLVTDINNKYYLRDAGFATENIVLAAEEENIGSCVLCKIDRNKIRKILKIPEKLEIDSVVALGYKAEQPVVEDMKDSVKYWRDENMVLHVPKRKLENILHINGF